MGKIRIAICDDHPVVRTGLTSVLATEPDIEVTIEAGSVQELLQRLETVPVDLVLLDVELPEESGIEALPKLVHGQRVLVLSAYDDARRIRRAMEGGATGYLRKDSPSRELIRAVHDAAAGKTVMSAELAIRLAEALRNEPDERNLRRIVDGFTPRQRDVLREIVLGRSNREIAEKLFLSEGTVKNHVTAILQAVGVPDRTRLVVLLHRYSLDG